VGFIFYFTYLENSMKNEKDLSCEANDSVNPVGGEDEFRTKTDDANSGSTHCSFSVILKRISSVFRFLILAAFDCLQSIESRLENWLKTDEEKRWEEKFRDEYRQK